jgi:hypothetical protein
MILYSKNNDRLKCSKPFQNTVTAILIGGCATTCISREDNLQLDKKGRNAASVITHFFGPEKSILNLRKGYIL